MNVFRSLSHKPYNDTYASISTLSLKRHINFIFFQCTQLLQTSPGVATSCLWATLGPPPALVNKVLLECRTLTHLRDICLLSHSYSRGAKDTAWPTKPKILTILPFTESFQTTALSII